MTAETTHYRPIEKKDFKALIELICKTWNYETLTTPFIASKLAAVFLFSSLAHHSYSQVAVKDGQIVGLIAGRDNDVPFEHNAYYLLTAWNIFLLLFSKSGREAFQSYKRYLNISESLLKQTHESYDGELLMFAVGDAVRGTGIGSRLFSLYLDFLRNKGARTFSLFTDTQCNYSFYEMKKLKRIGVVSRKMPFLNQEIIFFLYRGDLKTILPSTNMD
ncbi:Histone acetyltransferase HPA2 [Alkalibacterium sp. AK22]|uniref:GNAT family N-acetyltransferase n=1 Tax=Alkalibacterium sp. AK22 TaxID=1229520 RepID=UPI000452A657|nr:GNAT family N-acetyltransferase [Alkalibacterium sp. AK22]EXJ23220.1 Histone acetyltransferase HPA2 [Alkalibacterium sp. AK22]